MTRTTPALLALLALFFLSLPSPAQSPAAAEPAASEAPGDAADLFGHKCQFCHGEDGRGQTRKGKALKASNFTSARWQKHTTDDEIVSAITAGIPKKKMPAFGQKLTPAQIASLVPYLRAFASKAAQK